MRFRTLSGHLVAITAFIFAASLASYGQGNFEVAGHGGVVGGIGSHGIVGGSIGAPVADKLVLQGELSLIPMGSSSVTVNGTTNSSSAKAIDFNGTMQYEFTPTRGVVPYAGAGLGFLRSNFETSIISSGVTTFKVSGSATDAYFNFGGGLRYYVNNRWGFKPEFQFFAGSNTFVRFTGGIFYQFGE